MNCETVSQSRSPLLHLKMLDYSDDWRYSEERLELRGDALKTLLSNFGAPLDSRGRPLYSMESMVECAHDWVSQGNANTNGLAQYYWTNYT